MPKATIYIRDENWEAWQALPDRSQVINSLLAGDSVSGSKSITQPRRPEQQPAPPSASSKLMTPETTRLVRRPSAPVQNLPPPSLQEQATAAFGAGFTSKPCKVCGSLMVDGRCLQKHAVK